MGELVKEMLLIQHNAANKPSAHHVSEAETLDTKINRYDLEIEQQATILIATRQPLAIDLRQITSAIKIAVILERMGDLSKNVTRRISMVANILQEDLLEDINNMLILYLDVPPSAFIMLSEHEFSRSVASNNLFFCRCIAAYQKIFCELAARHVQIYTNMSEPLKNKIRAIISVKNKESATEDTDLIPSDSRTQDSEQPNKSKSIDDKLADVINHIITVLPAPSIAPSKTEFEELDTIINSINTTLEAVFDNDLGSTDDNPMSMIRALVKEQVIRDYMTKIGVMRDVSVPDILDPKFLSLINDRKLGMLNIISGLKAAVKATQPTTDVTTDISAPPLNTGDMPSSF